MFGEVMRIFFDIALHLIHLVVFVCDKFYVNQIHFIYLWWLDKEAVALGICERKLKKNKCWL